MTLTNNILLIEPIGFAFNHETALDNKFQNDISHSNTANEFQIFKNKLVEHGIQVVTFTPPDELTPDAVFPNNWFSTFPDGQFFIYPMKTINRRKEKRINFISEIGKHYHSKTDISFFEDEKKYLEGTGSLVIDHENKIAFAAISERTDLKAIEAWKLLVGYNCITFNLDNKNGSPIYHTNVMLSLTNEHAIICMDCIEEKDRNKIAEALVGTGRKLIEISIEQMNNFCGNCIALKNKLGLQLLIMSERARINFTLQQIEELEKYSLIVSSPLHEIEMIGGGSARCMIAELF